MGLWVEELRFALQVAVEEGRGGGVEALHRLALRARQVHLRAHFPCQRLAQLHAPLVERVDAPNEALHRDAVLVKGEELADGVGGQEGEEDAEGGAVARESLGENRGGNGSECWRGGGGGVEGRGGTLCGMSFSATPSARSSSGVWKKERRRDGCTESVHGPWETKRKC